MSPESTASTQKRAPVSRLSAGPGDVRGVARDVIAPAQALTERPSVGAPPGPPPAHRSRVVEQSHNDISPDRLARFSPALSGVWAVAQGMVLSFALLLFLAVVALLGAPDTAADVVPWNAAGSTAGALWLLGHGVPIGDLTVVPLGVGLLALFGTYVAAKRSVIVGKTSLLVGTATYLLVLVGAAAAAGVRGGGLMAAVAGALIVGGGGLALGSLAQPEAPRVAEVARRVFRWVPDVMRLGLRAGLLASALLLALAGVLTITWIIAGREASAYLAEVIQPGWIGGVVLAIAQVALLPNLVVWASAWLLGPGFSLGADTVYAATTVQPGMLPALPILGALPEAPLEGALASWLPAVGLLVGVIAGLFAWRQLEPALVRWGDLAWITGGAAASSALILGVLQAWAGGAAGTGRLSQIGAEPVLIGLVMAGLTFAGTSLVLALAHGKPWRHLPKPARRIAAIWGRLGNEPD